MASERGIVSEASPRVFSTELKAIGLERLSGAAERARDFRQHEPRSAAGQPMTIALRLASSKAPEPTA